MFLKGAVDEEVISYAQEADTKGRSQSTGSQDGRQIRRSVQAGYFPHNIQV